VEIQLHHHLSWHHSLFRSWIMRERMHRGARTRMRRVMFFNLRNLRNSSYGWRHRRQPLSRQLAVAHIFELVVPRTGFLQVTTANKHTEPDLR
jgi:hypothetical protein